MITTQQDIANTSSNSSLLPIHNMEFYIDNSASYCSEDEQDIISSDRNLLEDYQVYPQYSSLITGEEILEDCTLESFEWDHQESQELFVGATGPSPKPKRLAKLVPSMANLKDVCRGMKSRLDWRRTAPYSTLDILDDLPLAEEDRNNYPYILKEDNQDRAFNTGKPHQKLPRRRQPAASLGTYLLRTFWKGTVGTPSELHISNIKCIRNNLH